MLENMLEYARAPPEWKCKKPNVTVEQLIEPKSTNTEYEYHKKYKENCITVSVMSVMYY